MDLGARLRALLPAATLLLLGGALLGLADGRGVVEAAAVALCGGGLLLVARFARHARNDLGS